MKKIIPVFFVLLSFLFSCSFKDKTLNKEEDTGFGKVMLTISSASVNFFDFPLTVKSITLIHDNGETHELTTGFSVNLANFGENAQYILMDSNVPSGLYSRIMINLAFDKNSTVTYFDNVDAKNPVVRHLRSPTGKKLGVDNSNFLINMPFFTNTFEVQSSSPTHLNVAWDLSASTDVFKSSDDGWVIEFKPLVNASDIRKTIAVDLAGEYVERKSGKISLQSIFDSSSKGLIATQVKSNAKLFSDGKILSKQKFDALSPGGYVHVSGEIAIGERQATMSANKFVHYEGDKTVIKGLVLDKNEKVLDVFGGDVSASGYLTQPNKIYTLPTAVVADKKKTYGLFSKINIQLVVGQVEALFRGGLYQSSEKPIILKGKSEEIKLDENAVVEDSGLELNDDTFYFTLTDEETDSTDTADNNKTITLISYNGIPFSGDYKLVFDAKAIKVNWGSDSVWRGEGLILQNNNEANHEISLNVIEAVDPEVVRIFKYDFKLQDSKSSGGAVRPSVKFDEMKESQGKESLADRMIFSNPLELNGGGEDITCKSISMNLQSRGVEYKSGFARVVFELIQNEDEWDKDPESAVIDLVDFDGDQSGLWLLNSRQEVFRWFEMLMEVSDTQLLIKSMRVVHKSESIGEIAVDDGHCSLSPDSITIRWIREGTKLVDVFEEESGGKKSSWVTPGSLAGLIVGGAVVAAILGKTFEKVFNKLTGNKYANTRPKINFDPQSSIRKINDQNQANRKMANPTGDVSNGKKLGAGGSTVTKRLNRRR